MSRLVLGAIKDHDPLGKGPGLTTVFLAASVRWGQEYLPPALELFACAGKRERAEQFLGQAEVYQELERYLLNLSLYDLDHASKPCLILRLLTLYLERQLQPEGV